EVGIIGTSLLVGRVQAERLSLIGAEMAVRIEPNGEVTLFTGPDKHPVVPSSASVFPLPSPAGVPLPSAAPAPDPGTVAPPRESRDLLAGFLAWIDRLDSLGLDGSALAEVGLKNGTLVVRDQPRRKRRTF